LRGSSRSSDPTKLSMIRDLRLYLDDIVRSVELIQRYTTGLNLDQFESDQKTIDAVVRNLEIIGKAARNLPEEIRDLSTNIEWRKIIAMRNILAHEYFGINATIIWDIVQHKLITLRKFCERELDAGNM
jgi:uncharacterized protein with HEPN domain